MQRIHQTKSTGTTKPRKSAILCGSIFVPPGLSSSIQHRYDPSWPEVPLHFTYFLIAIAATARQLELAYFVTMSFFESLEHTTWEPPSCLWIIKAARDVRASKCMPMLSVACQHVYVDAGIWNRSWGWYLMAIVKWGYDLIWWYNGFFQC